MRRSKKLPLGAEGKQRKRTVYMDKCCPSYKGIILFRKQGVPTARVTVPAETSWKLPI